jgi:hypothetical protein
MQRFADRQVSLGGNPDLQVTGNAVHTCATGMPIAAQSDERQLAEAYCH